VNSVLILTSFFCPFLPNTLLRQSEMKLRPVFEGSQATTVPRRKCTSFRPTTRTANADDRASQYLVFPLGREEFGFPDAESTPRTCIIVFPVPGNASSMLMGLVVDGVAEVLNLAQAPSKARPLRASSGDALSVGRGQDQGQSRALDIDQVLTSQELLGLEALVQ